MTAQEALTDTLIQNSIVRAVQNVCRVMLGLEATLAEKSAGAVRGAGGSSTDVFGSVGFIGEVNGLVYLCIPDDFAKDAAARILGMTPAEVQGGGPEIVNDVIGEITNMTVGGFKNALCDVGFPCKLTLPTIVRGDNLTVAAIKAATRHVFHFHCAGHRLVADIQLKIGG